METERHRLQMTLLIESLSLAWADRTDFYVGGATWVYFSELQAKKNDFRGPDVFVVLDTVRKERRAWVVWEEDGKTPNVVIELLSDTTEHIDRGEKMRIYEKVLKVGEYFLFDPVGGTLDGYELDAVACEYRRKAPARDGRLPCGQLGLWLGKAPGRHLGVEAAWLRWSDAEGRVLPSAEELARRADAETRRADAEARRADAEARRADELAAELRALKQRFQA
jgi:Uma2 family endonuclease